MPARAAPAGSDAGARRRPNITTCISDGAFVAATSGVELKVRTQSFGNALFAQSGGFFITETAGVGQVAVSGFGSMSQLDVDAGQAT